MATNTKFDNTAQMERPITCLKFGIIVKPPALVLIYKEGEILRRKTIPLRTFKPDSICELAANDVKSRYELPLPRLKIERFLRILQEMMKGKTNEEAVRTIDNAYNNENLNKLPTKELNLQKEAMDTVFNKNQVSKESSDFKYDKQVAYKPKNSSEWDEEFWDDKE